MRRVRTALPPLALLALLASPVLALDPPGAAAGSLTPIGPDALAPVLPLSDALATALASRDHDDAVAELQKLKPSDLRGSAFGDRAFLLAWSLVRAGRATEAVPLLHEVEKAEAVPEPYRLLVEGELLAADARPVEAAKVLETVSPDSRVWVRAQLEEAEAQQKAGATAASRKIYESLIARPDPQEGSDTALWSLAQRAGPGSDAAYPLLRRLWTAYPRTRPKDVAAALAAYEGKGPTWQPTLDQIAARGDTLQEAERWDDTIAFLGPLMPRFSTPGSATCRARYAYGRALFKRNRLADAISALQPIGTGCKGIDAERGGRALYIAGKALERKQDWAGAAALYQKIPALYPAHSMADDGDALAGIAWQEAGDPARAVKLWEAQVNDYPDGDLAAEAFWRLAWARYLAGDADGAIALAERMIWEVPLEVDPTDVLGARYWSARWRIYPDVHAPTTQTSDSNRIEQGISLWSELCREQPTSYFALLAADRLYELAPDELAQIPRPRLPSSGGSLLVRASFAQEPAVGWALALNRLGLVSDALSELARFPESSLTPSELALVTRIQGQLDPVLAHNRLHHFLLLHPPATLGADALEILLQAYPQLYWQELQAAAADYDWDPRIFHGLVREESSFNTKIVSFAGARGLSQLMPATARSVARAMGTTVTNDRLFDPTVNLTLGAHFYDSLQNYYKGSFYLATASYNAGQGNVDRWLQRFGDVPVDEFVEDIPIRETRGYVKRVLGTYQMYHVLYDPGPLFSDWSRTNHAARPG